MIKIIKFLGVCALVIAISTKVSAQLSGTYNIPTNYTNLAAAISALNSQGVNGPVIIELNAGYTETAPTGGFSLTATGTSVNTITFRKTGTGANPLITAPVGVSTPASAIQDGIWRFIGSDYITIDGIDLVDVNTTNPASMEYGYGFFKTSVSDGCQNNTIKNCVIDLRTVNNAAGTTPAVDGSRGINVVNSLHTTQTTAVTPTSFSGSNSNNKFYANTIRNCNVGVALIGYVAPSPFTLADTGNDVGGTSSITGNSILNFGGGSGATNPAAGIRTLAQYNLNASYNVFNNNTGSGANHAAALRAIYTNLAASANVSITNNTITVNSSASAVQLTAIENVSGAGASNNTITINNNLITNSSHSLNTTGSFLGIFNNAASSAYLDISGNKFSGVNTTASTGSNYLIYNTGAVTTSISIKSNQIDNCKNAASTSGAYGAIFNNVVSTAILDVSGNAFNTNTVTASTGNIYMIYNASATTNSILINNNTSSACSHTISSSGIYYGIFNSGASSANLEIKQNTFTNHRVVTATGTNFQIYNSAAVTNSIVMSDNLFSACVNSITSTGSYFGIYNNAASSSNLEMSGNTFTNIAVNAVSGANHFIYNRGALTNTFSSVAINGNLISNCSHAATGAAPFYSIWNNGVTSTITSINNNTITSSIWTAATSTRYLISNFGPALTSETISGNLISNCTHTNNTTGVLYNIYNNNATTVSSGALNISNNTFLNNSSTATTGETHLINNSSIITNTFTSISIINNLISNYTSGVSGIGAFFCFYNNTASALSINVSQNTFTSSLLNSSTGATYFIYNRGVAGNLFTSVTASNNILSGLTHSNISNGIFYGIVNAGAATTNCALLSIQSNSFMNSSSSGTSGGIVLVNNTCPVTTSITIATNSFVNLTNTVTTTGTFYAINNGGNSSAGDLFITNNSFVNLISTASTSNRFLVYNNGGITNSLSLSNNFVSECSHSITSGGSFYGIYNNSASSGLSAELSNNTFTNNYSASLGGSTNLILNLGLVTTTLSNVSMLNNLVDSYTSVATTGAFNAIVNSAFTSLNLNLLTNTITNVNVSATNGVQQLLANSGRVTNAIAINGNLVSAYTSTTNTGGSLLGIYNAANYANSNFPQTLNILNNKFDNSTFKTLSGSVNMISSSGVQSNTISAISISGNLLTNLSHTLTSTGSFYGINNSAITSGSLSISGNSITSLNVSSTVSARYMVFSGGAFLSRADLSNNVFSNVSSTLNTTGSFFGINNGAQSQGSISISNNTFDSHKLSATSAVCQLLYNSGTVNSINFTGNFVSGVNHTATTGAFVGVFNNAASSSNLNITANSFTNIVGNSTTGALYLIYSNRSPTAATVTDITISGNSSSAIMFPSQTGSFYGIFNNNMSFSTLSIGNNTLSNVVTTSTNGTRYFIYNTGSGSTMASITNNLSSDFTSTLNAGANFFGIYNTGNQLGDLIVSGNTFLNHNLRSTTGSAYISYNTASVTGTVRMDNNLVSNLTHSSSAGGSFFGIYNNAYNSSGLSISSNTLINTSFYTTLGSTQYLTSRGVNTTVAIGSISILNNVVGAASFSSSSGTFNGILNTQISFTNLNVSGNIFSNFTSTTSSAPRYFISNSGLSFSTTNISSNTVTDYNATGNTTGVFYNAVNTGSVSGNLTISGNTFSVENLPSSTAACYMINNTALVTGSISIANNLISTISHSSTTGVLYGVLHNATSVTDLSITTNSLVSIATTNSANIKYLVYNTSPASVALHFNGNVISGYSAPFNTTGSFGAIYNTANSQGSFEANSNVVNNVLLPATTGTCYAIFTNGTVSTTSSLSNNLISNLSYTSGTTGTFYGIFNRSIVTSTSPVSSLNMSANTLSNCSVSVPTAPVFLVYAAGSPTINIPSLTMNSNVISGFTITPGTGTLYGIYNGSISSASLSMSGNTYTNCSTSASNSPRYLIYNTGSVTSSMVFDNNRVSNFKSLLNAGGNFYGVYNSAACLGSLSMNSNDMNGNGLEFSAGNNYLIYNAGAVANNMSLNSNTVSNTTSSATPASGNFYGVYNSAVCSGSLSMNSNYVGGNAVEFSSGINFLVHNAGAVSNGISMNTNTISNNANSTNTSTGAFYALYNSGASPSSLSMDLNSVVSNSSALASGNTHLIYNTGAISNSISMSFNKLGQVFTNATVDYSGNFYNVFNAGGTSATSLAINSNTFTGYSYTGIPGSGNIYFVNNTNNNARYDIDNNLWTSISLYHNGNEYLMYNPSNTSSQLNVTNNTATNYSRTATAAALYMYYSNGNSPATCSQVFSGNSFSNIFAGTQGTGSFYGIYSMDGSGTAYPKKQAFNNSISNVTYNALGFFYGYYFDFLGDGLGSGSSVYNNTLTGVSWAGPCYGLYIGGNVSSGFAANVFSNTVSHFSITAITADIHGAYLLGGGSGLNFFKNKIGDLNAFGTQGKAEGIRVNSAVNTTLYNNLIGNIFTPLTTLGDAIKGINVAGGSNVKVFYNTVKLSAASSGSLFGSTALYALSSVSLDLRNNILINSSIPSGVGLTTAYFRSSNSLSGYQNSSNNNIFYTGIPSSSHLIFYDGTNSCQTLPAYQATVSPRDNASASENTPFLSTAITSTNFLHVDFTIPSVTESGAVNVNGINDDVDSEIRQGNTGYVGTGTASDIGADEYEQSLIPCSGASAGTIAIPTSTINCEGQTIYLLSTGYTAAGDITHQWKVSSTSGGPYSNVAGGIGANTTAYTTSTLSSGTYYFVLVTTCNNGNISGTSNQLTVVVNSGPTASASVSSPTLCSGLDLNFTASSNIGVNYYWTGPNNFTSTIQNPTITNAVTNSGGTYTLYASDANCTSAPALVHVIVHATPPDFSLVPPSSSICIGGSQTITASIPITSPTLNFGSQTIQNAASGYPAPYSVYYGGQKMQMLILASELASAGFTTGTPIQSVQFPIAGLGSNWNSTLFSCQNFMVGMKSTTTSVLSVFETGISNVVPLTSYTPSVGYNNIHTFSAPFIWDGLSNLVLETVFSNSIVGTSGNTVAQYNSPIGFQSTLVYRADNQSVSAIAAATTSNVNIGFVRPDFKLNGTQVGTYSWSPSNSLSSSAGVSVVASPTATSIYSVELSDGQCASSTTVSLDVIQNPSLTISTTATTVCLGNAATLTAMGANQYTWSSGITQPSIAVSPFVSTTYTVFGSNPVCPPSSTTILISSAPAFTLTSQVLPPVICLGASSTLSVSGASNYTWTGGANTNSITVTPGVTTTYSVIAYNGPGCWTTKNLNVKVNPLPVITVTPSGATICSGESVVFEAGGVYSFTWTPTVSNSPIYEVNPLSTTAYTVVGSDQNNCLNNAVVTVVVEPCTGIASTKNITQVISVFPNPSSGIINIEFGFDGEKTVRVENSIGSLILETKIMSQEEEIDLRSYAKGIYFVYIKTGVKSASYKIIVE
ncbi:hypothetical protein CNR22_15550 [Sphingobacteriaceae bacterium]|nr:hypothetical protein CNR22_15550 [Sphingobacteriaceae bacterium]